MTAPLHVVGDDDSDRLPIADWNRVVEHIRACWPYSRPWTVETQQAFYDALCRFSYPELIGAASHLARSAARKEPRERPALAEMYAAASRERAELERMRTEARLRVVPGPWRGWRDMEMAPPGEDAGPFYRLAYAIHQGEVPEHYGPEHESFLRAHGVT